MKIKEMVERIVSSKEKIQVEKSVSYLVGVFGPDIFRERDENKRFKDFKKGIRPYVEVRKNFLKKRGISLNDYPYEMVIPNKLYRLYKTVELRDAEKLNPEKSNWRINGELFGYPPSAIGYFEKRSKWLRQPGDKEDEMIYVRWSSSGFVTTKELLEENLRWMKSNYGRETGKCMIYKSFRKFTLEKEENGTEKMKIEKHYYTDVVSVDIEDIQD